MIKQLFLSIEIDFHLGPMLLLKLDYIAGNLRLVQVLGIFLFSQKSHKLISHSVLALHTYYFLVENGFQSDCDDTY